MRCHGSLLESPRMRTGSGRTSWREQKSGAPSIGRGSVRPRSRRLAQAAPRAAGVLPFRALTFAKYNSVSTLTCQTPADNFVSKLTEALTMSRAVAWPIVAAESGIDRHFKEIQRFLMLDPQDEYLLAKRWREAGDRDAADRLIVSHLRLVAKIARGYRGYGLPLADLTSEGHVGLMQAVERFEPERGFRFSTYAVWWIKSAIQGYILRSWSLVKMGSTANHRKLFFNLRKAKSRISALDEGDIHPDQVKLIAKRLGVTERAVIDMNRRLGGDASLNDPIGEDRDST